MIHTFKPFNLDKKVGIDYNAHCALVPNPDDWILIMDYDAMILTPETFQVIQKAIDRYPETLVFGAMCNRINLTFHRLGNKPDENDSIKHHLAIAKERAAQYAEGECDFGKHINQIAGFFLLFRKSYWMENPFQEPIMNTVGNLFDYVFTRNAGKVPGGCKVILGAYLWHTYRIDKNYLDRSHLK